MQVLQWMIAHVQGLSLGTIWGAELRILLLCNFDLPIPEDITLILCGYMTFKKVGLAWDQAALATLIGLTGVLVGDGIMFTLGRRQGQRLLGVWPFRHILGGGRLEKTRDFLANHGPKVLFTARFTPGLRSVVFFTSGTLGIPLGVFLFYDGLAALVSVPALVLSAWYWGDTIDLVVAKAQKGERGVLLVLLAMGLLLLGRKLWQRHRAKQKRAEALPEPAAD